MMNTDGTTGGNNMGLGQVDDQQMITSSDRENFIARLTHHFHGNRDMAKHYDDQAITRSGGKAAVYRKVLQMMLQQRSQQIQQMQQQQQQQQTMMTPQQQQQQTMYMQSQQTTMVGMPQQQQQQQQQPPLTYTMQAPLSSSIAPPTPMMNIKQEPQVPMSNIQMRPNPQNFPMQQQQQQQQQQQIKQELMVPQIPQQQLQIKQELMIPPIPQQQPGVPIQQMRQQQQPLQYNQQQQQQPPALPNQSTTTTPQQRIINQQLQQVRQQNYLNQQQQQQESSNSIQLQQQQPSNPSTLPQSSSMNNTGSSSSTSTPTTSAGSSDEILQQLLTSPNPPKQPSTVAQNVAQARLRTINRNVRNPTPQIPPQQLQQQSSPMTPGSDPMMTGNIPSPHSHPGMMQQPQTPIGPPGQGPLTRYMMAQSPQAGVYRPQMSPMNMMNYASSPTTMIDEEMHYLFKYFTDRIHYLTRIITRCQQEGQHDKVAKYRQLHDQMAAFVRNPIPEHLMAARRLKDHVDRLLDPRMFGPVMMAPMVDMTGMIPVNNNGNRLMTNGIFEQCQRAIVDYLNKDTIFKYNVSKRFLEPLSEVLNGVPHKNMRLDIESKQLIEPYSSLPNTQLLTSLVHIIENEFSHLSMNTFTYELKPLSDKISTSTIDFKDLPIRDYELTCRFIEINMPIVPPLKMKLTIKYPNEPPEVLSLTSTTLNLTPAKLENSDGHSFFESISRNFIYFLFKLPAQHTVTDILDIWRTAIQNASLTEQES